MRHHGALTFLVLVAVLFGVSVLYQDDIVALGNHLLARVGSDALYAVLFGLAAVSSTLLPLPVWIYALTAVALGLNYMAAGLVIGLGSSVGSTSTYCLGRYCSQGPWLRGKLDEVSLREWRGRSRPYCGLALFFGTVSPVPMDVAYAIAGALHFPAPAFVFLVTAARVLRYESMAFVFFAVR